MSDLERLTTLLLPVLHRLYPDGGEDKIAAATVARTLLDGGWRWISAQRVEAAMERTANLAVEAYEPTISELTAALLGSGT